MPICKQCNKEFISRNKKNTTFCSEYCSNIVHSRCKDEEKRRQFGRESYHRRKADPKNIISFILRNAKARAKKKAIEFSLKPSDIILPELCPILHIPLSKNSRRYGYSLDRIDPTKGYTSDNVWVISQIANAMKWDSTKEERILFAKWVLDGEKGV